VSGLQVHNQILPFVSGAGWWGRPLVLGPASFVHFVSCIREFAYLRVISEIPRLGVKLKEKLSQECGRKEDCDLMSSRIKGTKSWLIAANCHSTTQTDAGVVLR